MHGTTQERMDTLKAQAGAAQRPATQRHTRIAGWLAALLLALTLAKMCWAVLGAPVLGYADNWDFVRQSSCHGVWLIDAQGQRVQGDIGRVHTQLHFDGEKAKSNCTRSSDNLFSKATTWVFEKGAVFDIRVIGLIKIAAVAAMTAAVLVALGSVPLRLTAAFLLALVLGDWVHLLYFNTLYHEVSTIAGLCLALLLLADLAQQQGRARQRGSGYWLLWVLILLWLGLSKHQYMPLAAVLCALAALCLARWRIWRPGALLLALALLIPLAYGQMNKPKGLNAKIPWVNSTNTVLEAVLPAAPDPQAALQTLQLPPSCMAGKGLNWYAPGMLENHPCPALKQFSRKRLLALFVQQPATFFTPMRIGLANLSPFHAHAGIIVFEAAAPDGSSAALRRQMARGSSLSTALAAWLGLNQAPWAWQALFWLAALASPLCLGLAVLRRSSSGSARAAYMLLGLGGMVMFYSLFSSVFGDGYVEVPRHAVGLLVGLYAWLTGLLWLAVQALVRRRLGQAAGPA